MATPKLSIVIPCYNEAENIAPLCQEISEVISSEGYAAEVIVVDDGSTDGTRDRYPALSKMYPWLRILLLKRNFGQTAAMRAGIEAARGEVIVPMDADLQNDPKDIPKLLAKIEQGLDVVSGWRRHRQDAAVSRKIPSILANGLISWVSGVRLHDLGCTLKAYRREALEDVVLYGEMHRFIPVYAHWVGGKVGEIVVNHRPRHSGQSKYGLGRTFRVVLDLITAKFLCGYAQKPIHFFGIPGILLGLIGFITAFYLSVQKFVSGIHLSRSPMLLLAILMMLLGFMLVMLGVLAEVIIRTYHESQGKATYRVAAELHHCPKDQQQPDGTGRADQVNSADTRAREESAPAP